MKILVSVDPEVPVPPRLYGGIERIVDGLVTELRLRGHQVGLVAHPDSTCPVEQFFPWPARAPGSRPDNLKHTLTLWRASRAFRPDVVHSFSRLGYLLPLLLTGQPAIMSYQRHTGGPRLRIMAGLGGDRFAFTGCSEYIARMGRAVAGRWSGIPNFVDTGFYQFRAQVPADAPLVFLSRVERIKGTHTAIEIARRAGRRLIIAGNQADNAEGQTYWKTEVEPHLRAGVVEYVGPVDDRQKNELLGSALGMLVPVEWGEPFGIVFAEALACGTPVISCPLGALPEIVREGVDGFLINDVPAGVAAVGKLASLRRSDCRERVEQLFSRTVVGTQYEQLYRELATR